MLGDCVQQVSFPQAGSAVNEQRVVVPAGLFGYGHCCRVGKTIGRSDNEILKRVLGKETLWCRRFLDRNRKSIRRLGVGVFFEQGLVVWFVGGGKLDGKPSTKGDRHGIFNQRPELLVDPAEMELAGCGDVNYVVGERLWLEPIEPGPPGDRGDASTERLPELFPALGGRMRFHVLPRSALELLLLFSTGVSTPVEKPLSPIWTPPSGRTVSGTPSAGSRQSIDPVEGEYMGWRGASTRETKPTLYTPVEDTGDPL